MKRSLVRMNLQSKRSPLQIWALTLRFVLQSLIHRLTNITTLNCLTFFKTLRIAQVNALTMQPAILDFQHEFAVFHFISNVIPDSSHPREELWHFCSSLSIKR